MAEPMGMAAALGALDIEDIGNSIDEEIGASAGGSGGSEDGGECSAGRPADGEPAPEQSRGGGADRLPELDVTPLGDRPHSPSQVTLLTDARPLPHRRHPSPHRGGRAAPCGTCHPRPQRYGLPQLPPGGAQAAAGPQPQTAGQAPAPLRPLQFHPGAFKGCCGCWVGWAACSGWLTSAQLSRT